MTAVATELRILSNLRITFLARNRGTHISFTCSDFRTEILIGHDYVGHFRIGVNSCGAQAALVPKAKIVGIEVTELGALRNRCRAYYLLKSSTGKGLECIGFCHELTTSDSCLEPLNNYPVAGRRNPTRPPRLENYTFLTLLIEVAGRSVLKVGYALVFGCELPISFTDCSVKSTADRKTREPHPLFVSIAPASCQKYTLPAPD